MRALPVELTSKGLRQATLYGLHTFIVRQEEEKADPTELSRVVSWVKTAGQRERFKGFLVHLYQKESLILFI